MNIVFMGTPDFAVASLEKIYNAGHNILAVVSQMDKPSGRGMKLQPTPVKQFAESKNLKIMQPEKIKRNQEFMDELKSLKPDVIVVVAYGKILPGDLMKIPKFGCINVHGSLLPKYRGSAPIQWAIINGEKETGITTMYMDEGVDTGDMILSKKVVIEDEDTYGTLYEKLKVVGANLIVETLERIADEMAPREKQSGEYTLAPMIEKEDCKIDWNKTATEIRNLIKGVNPMPGAYTFIDDKLLKVWNAQVIEGKTTEIPGTIIESDSKKGLYIATGNGILNLTEIQAQNEKRMNTLDYLRGKKIEIGKILL